MEWLKIDECILNIAGEIAVYARAYPWRPDAHSEQVHANLGVQRAYVL